LGGHQRLILSSFLLAVHHRVGDSLLCFESLLL
jgi:hypothetical protein